MYHSQLGRFVSRDPIGYEGSKWGLYEYVSSAPLNRHDPLGLQWPDPLIYFHPNPAPGGSSLDADRTGGWVPGGLVRRGFAPVYGDSIPLGVFARRYGYWDVNDGFETPLSWGCGGMAAIRAGYSGSGVSSMPHLKPGTICCTELAVAQEELAAAQEAGDKPLLIAVQTSLPAAPKPGSERHPPPASRTKKICECRVHPDDITLDINRGQGRNFASWLGISTDDSFWEDAVGGHTNRGSVVRHQSDRPGGYAFEYFCIVPKAWNPSPPAPRPRVVK